MYSVQGGKQKREKEMLERNHLPFLLKMDLSRKSTKGAEPVDIGHKLILLMPGLHPELKEATVSALPGRPQRHSEPVCPPRVPPRPCSEMPFVEDPAHLPKSRLKSDLVAHNVALPPTASKKDVYVELHLKHVEQKQTADFSSDDEDQERNVADDDDILGDEKLPDARTLTDDELKAALLKYGVKAGPIVASTRSVYENKLRKLLQPEGQDDVSGALTAELYSDSEEEEIQEHGEKDDEESGSEEELTVELTKHAPQESNQAELFNKSSAYSYPQCFIPSTRLRVHPSRLRESIPVRNSRKAKKFFEQRSFHCSKIPTDFSRASSVDHCSGLGLGVLRSDSLKPKDCLSRSTQTFSITQMVKEMESRCSHSPSSDAREEFNGSNEQERWSRSNRLDEPIVDKCRLKDQTLYFTPEVPSHQRGKELPRKHLDDVLKNMYKDTPKTPTGIFVTSRRPIKGAAQRPVEYDYPDPPVSPMTFERREVERRLVPIYIRILLYVLLVCILFFIYINVEEINFVEEWQDRISQWSGSEETKYLQVETEDMDRVFGQE